MFLPEKKVDIKQELLEIVSKICALKTALLVIDTDSKFVSTFLLPKIQKLLRSP
jgi:Mg-chelatase subunit ChlD